MADELAERFVLDNYEIHEWRHAKAILNSDFTAEWMDIIEVLASFRLTRSSILKPGGRKSPIATALDRGFYERGWIEKTFQTKVVVDSDETENPTHGIDCFKNRVALEVEWNNKDPFYDRDLNNFRVLFDLGAISVGVIVTRSDTLQQVFDDLGKGKSYGASTTHMSRLLPRVDGSGAGGCPILVLGITPALYVEDE